jgi:hypothetical protein
LDAVPTRIGARSRRIAAALCLIEVMMEVALIVALFALALLLGSRRSSGGGG